MLARPLDGLSIHIYHGTYAAVIYTRYRVAYSRQQYTKNNYYQVKPWRLRTSKSAQDFLAVFERRDVV